MEWKLVKICDKDLLGKCDEMHVGVPQDREKSLGVVEEIKMAKKLGLKIIYN